MGLQTATWARVIAALILVIAVFAIAPAVDAATCVPEVPSAHQVLAHDPATGDHSGQGSDSAVCAHGHCHHSAGERFSSTDYEAAGTHARRSTTCRATMSPSLIRPTD